MEDKNRSRNQFLLVMKEYHVPYNLWKKIPYVSTDKRIGYMEMVEALNWKAEMERNEYERIKKESSHGDKGGRTIQFE